MLKKLINMFNTNIANPLASRKHKKEELQTRLLNNNILHLKHEQLILCVIDGRIHIVQPLSLKDLNTALSKEADFLINTEVKYA